MNLPFPSPLLLPAVDPPRLPLPLRPAARGSRAEASKVSTGFLAAVNNVREKEEYRKARAQVERKGVEIDDLLIKGISVGGMETCIVIPSFNLAFDIGSCPSAVVSQDHLFITHAHIDHIGGLPMYIATRALYSLTPPTVFVSPCIKEDVEKLIDVHRTMSKDRLDFELVALDVGETYEIRNDLVVRPFKTSHVIPSQGYVVYSVRKKLKKQYTHLKGNQILKLKRSGVEITDIKLHPELAFTGDTTADFILDPRSADALRAEILITEATFLDEVCDVEHARKRGHMHLSEIMEHVEWFRNKAILLTHFSSRYNVQDIRNAVVKLQPKISAKVFTLTEGFKSAHK